LLSGASLFLDFDGTLVEIESTPGAVRVGERLQTLVANLTVKLEGRLAIVSGRPVEQIHALFGNTTLAVAGSHGIEMYWPDGRAAKPAARAFDAAVLAPLRHLQEAHPGVVIEVKPHGVAVHYRMAPAAEQDSIHTAHRVARESGLSIQRGKMVIELKTETRNKGDAIAAFMSDAAMRGTRPVFIGDDETDEAGFLLAARLGGAGVLVGPERSTAAVFRLPTVGDTLAWLEAAGEAIS
jgi:trehalose 6-phosphate phosphatase